MRRRCWAMADLTVGPARRLSALAGGCVVRLERVGKRYGFRQPWIVRDVSLDIPAGRLIRLEGANGSGKSTLLRVIAGVSVPTSGTVAGRPRTGYVPERFPPALPFSAREYLTHLGRVHGLAGPQLTIRIGECLDRLGGSEFAEIPLRAMSKGMCQKVAVAQALLPGSGLLILDEAWTGLDAAARLALDGVVAERIAGGSAVVFVDHDQRRLAEQRPERWQVKGGQVSVVAQAGARPAGAAGAGPSILIELTGYPRESPPPDWLAGVVSARQDGDAMVVLAEPGASDSVLRALLAAGDRVHVRSVRPERETAGPGSAPVRQARLTSGPRPDRGPDEQPEPGAGPEAGAGPAAAEREGQS
jgi:ABC-2 type transport system ATP-binding protein